MSIQCTYQSKNSINSVHSLIITSSKFIKSKKNNHIHKYIFIII